MNLAYFVHEVSDPAVRKRVKMLQAGGARVTLLGFERRSFSGEDGAAPIILGRTKSGKFAERALSVLFAAPRAFAVRQAWAQADTIVARNLEMLALVCGLAFVMRLRARIVYECLDIHRLMLSDGALGKALRWVERLCLRRTAFILTSSPAFDAAYFRDVQGFRGETLVIENKVLSLDGELAPSNAAPLPGPPWRITWCGVLRCKRSFEALRKAADLLDPLVEIELWGVPALEQIPDFHAGIAASPRMHFRGAYAPSDLPAIYARTHYVWAIDFYEAGGNSDWLLPNRLYEGLRFGAVPIAVAGVETARWLEAHDVGVILDGPLAETLDAFIRTASPGAYAQQRAAAAELDRHATTADLSDCRALVAHMRGEDERRAA